MYKRLTARNSSEMAYLVNVKHNEQDVESPYPNTLRCILDSFNRLAEYEETELSPEEITDKIGELENQISELKTMLEIYRGFDGCRLHQLIEADMDGRLVVLPCKAGDAVYVLTADSLNGIEETSINRIVIKKNRIALNANCKHDDWGRAAWDFRPSDFGKTVFLTKEAAEKALGGSDGSSKDE